MIFKTIASLINLALMFLFYTMPIWIIFLILTIKYKKKNIAIPTDNEIKETNIIVPTNDEVKKEGLFSFVFNKNKTILFNSTVVLILVFLGFIFIKNGGCEGGATGCLGLAIMLMPFILCFIVLASIVLVKLISSIVDFYHPNQKKFHISGWIIFIIIIVLVVLNFATPFIRKYFRQSNQTNQNTQINSQVNNEAPPYFVKGTFKTKDTNETFSYIENYVPNIIGTQDYDQNAVSNCISWDLQGDFQCKKVYFIENNSDKKRLAIYNEKSDAVVGKIGDTLLFSEGKLVTQFPNPRKIDDLVSYAIDYKFNGENYRFQRPENLCKNDNGKVVCHDPSFKINDKVITFHITGLRTNNFYGVYPADKVIETDMISYQEYKYGEVYPIVKVN